MQLSGRALVQHGGSPVFFSHTTPIQIFPPFPTIMNYFNFIYYVFFDLEFSLFLRTPLVTNVLCQGRKSTIFPLRPTRSFSSHFQLLHQGRNIVSESTINSGAQIFCRKKGVSWSTTSRYTQDSISGKGQVNDRSPEQHCLYSASMAAVLNLWVTGVEHQNTRVA